MNRQELFNRWQRSYNEAREYKRVYDYWNSRITHIVPGEDVEDALRYKFSEEYHASVAWEAAEQRIKDAYEAFKNCK